MAAPSTPTNFYVQQANATAYLLWDQMATSTSYIVQRSQDGLTYATLATIIPVSTFLNNFYVDSSVTAGQTYYYKVAAANNSGADVSSYTSAGSCIPSLSALLSLQQARIMSQQRADRLGSNFVTLPEWNALISQSYFELYDLLIDSLGSTTEAYNMADPVSFLTDGTNTQFTLPNGSTQFYNSANTLVTAPACYRLLGVDLAVQGNNAWITLKKFNFIDRNNFIFPNAGGAAYGIVNMRYREMGSTIGFMPLPSANQRVRLWYIPRLVQPVRETDMLDGVSGWLEYVIVDAAIKALQKEESDVSVLMAQKQALIARIQSSAPARDSSQPDTISDVRAGNFGYPGFGGPVGGY